MLKGKKRFITKRLFLLTFHLPNWLDYFQPLPKGYDTDNAIYWDEKLTDEEMAEKLLALYDDDYIIIDFHNYRCDWVDSAFSVEMEYTIG